MSAVSVLFPGRIPEVEVEPADCRKDGPGPGGEYEDDRDERAGSGHAEREL
jgi:hypothetical protein